MVLISLSRFDIENEEKNSQWFKEDKRQFFEQFPSFSEQSLKELFSDEILYPTGSIASCDTLKGVTTKSFINYFYR